MTQQHHTGADTVRIGVDFGVSTTVIAVAVPGHKTTQLEIPGISREYPGHPPVHAIPSLAQYEGGEMMRCGAELTRSGAADHPGTARWMRRHLCDRSSVQIPAGEGRTIRYDEAATTFLTGILTRALAVHPGAVLAIALPPDAPPEYGEFLQRAARAAGASTCPLVSEYRAALAGCGCMPQEGEPVLIITVPETEPEIVIVSGDERESSPSAGGMRVLVRAAGSAGCHAIDGWIAQDLRVKFRLLAGDPRAVRLAPGLRCEATRLRELLPRKGEQEVQLEDTVSGKTFTTVYTTADLDRVLADHGFIVSLQDWMNRALSAMRMRGADESRIHTVLLLGEGAALPRVRDAVRARFPAAAVHADHPLDAIARGAAEVSAQVRMENRIACSCALRYWDPVVQEHHYRYLVHSGDRYPSAGQVARIIISAAYDGQTHLGIPLYQIGGDADGSMPALELVSDSGGGVRLAGPAQDMDARKQAVHANERSPTLLVADPPARKGEPRFECTFSVDAERNLCLSARDLVTGMLVKLNAPVHRLT